jgi:hypothetical protein
VVRSTADPRRSECNVRFGAGEADAVLSGRVGGRPPELTIAKSCGIMIGAASRGGATCEFRLRSDGASAAWLDVVGRLTGPPEGMPNAKIYRFQSMQAAKTNGGPLCGVSRLGCLLLFLNSLFLPHRP